MPKWKGIFVHSKIPDILESRANHILTAFPGFRIPGSLSGTRFEIRGSGPYSGVIPVMAGIDDCHRNPKH
jgi:hypothetical protein